MKGCGKPRYLDNFSVVSQRILRNGLPAEFGQIFHGKLWALVINLEKETDRFNDAALGNSTRNSRPMQKCSSNSDRHCSWH